MEQTPITAGGGGRTITQINKRLDIVTWAYARVLRDSPENVDLLNSLRSEADDLRADLIEVIGAYLDETN